jgi:hypothetical protein
MNPPPEPGRRGRCVNCWPFAETPTTHVVKLPPAGRFRTWADSDTTPRPRRWFLCAAHAAQIVRFHRSVGVPARAYRYRRIRGTQPHPTPGVLVSGY